MFCLSPVFNGADIEQRYRWCKRWSRGRDPRLLRL